MKVYISADMEGITGINGLKFIFDKEPEYTRGRKLMMQDLNAAIDGAVEAGATEILVNDAHGSMRNLMIEDLHEAADLITGFPKRQLMMAGMDESFDAVMFIGYHAKGGSEGVLSHTINGGVFGDIKINGKSYGETGINAAIAGFYNVPVVMISGDDMLQKEVREILPDAAFVTTKIVMSGYAAKMLHPIKTKKMIKDQAMHSLLKKDSTNAFILPEKLSMEIIVDNPEQADVIEIIPGLKRIAATTVTYAPKDIIEATHMICTISNACCVLKVGMY
ncbi:MAG: M55 family metallopeptidase [Deltaproteobacteria bacterium]|nr:M55 family metallopeptidase [Deltaproteobacteria bacterium]